jgi:hypothetical protein
MDHKAKAYKILVGEPEGKRLSGRPRNRWEEGRKLRTACMWLRIGTSDGLL